MLNNNFTVDFDSERYCMSTYKEKNWKVSLVDTGINTLKGGRIKRLEDYLDDEINLLTWRWIIRYKLR